MRIKRPQDRSRERRERIDGFYANKPEPDKRLMEAIYRHWNTYVKELLDQGVEVNAQRRIDKQTPLLVAVSDGNLELVKLLLEHGAMDAVNLFDDNTVKRAASERHLEIMKLLVEAGFDVDIQNHRMRTPLMALCQWADAEDSVRLLLDHGADVNNVSDGGATALSIAVGFRRRELIRILLEKGVSPIIEELGGGISIQVRMED